MHSIEPTPVTAASLAACNGTNAPVARSVQDAVDALAVPGSASPVAAMAPTTRTRQVLRIMFPPGMNVVLAPRYFAAAAKPLQRFVGEVASRTGAAGARS